jgi:hypothetical protein
MHPDILPNGNPTVSTTRRGDLIYRLKARLADLYPLGTFAEGIRFHNSFEGTIVAGPFEGARIFGLDEFLLRPDGVGEIVAPEVIDDGENRVSVQVRGYVVPPDGMDVPPLDVIASPGFAFPDIDFRVTGSGLIKTTAPEYERLNRVVAVLEGRVNLATGALEVEARAA